VVLAEPSIYLLTQTFRKLPHLCGFELGDGVGPLVIGDVAFLAECVEPPRHLAGIEETACLRARL
jgi:hypothetical protein